MAFDQNKYISQYKKEHYHRFEIMVKNEVSHAIKKRMEMEGFKSMKDFFFYLYREEYGVDLSKVKEKEPVEKTPSGEV